jgi:glycosyltransferase involved in cell wall biosynthesis
MKKMSVCFFLLSSGWGGAENVVFHLAKYIEKQGHHVTIILNDETYPFFKDLHNVKLYNIGSVFTVKRFLFNNFYFSLPKFVSRNKKFLIVIKNLIYPVLSRLNYLKIRKKVLQTIEEINPDFIHFNNPVVLQFSSYLLPYIKYPTIYTSHGLDFESQINQFYKLNIRKNRRILTRFNKITAVSTFQKHYLISNGITHDIEVIHDGIDIEKINNIMSNNPVVNHNKRFTLIFTGGEKKNKGGEILLEAIKIVKNQNDNLKLYYCGFVTTDFMKKYQDKDVIFTGLLPQKEYLKLLSTCDCLTLLSKTESFSLVILEAMGFGKTILTTRAGGIPELFIDGVNGFFVERDPQKIAEKIIYLMNTPDVRINISKNNIQFANDKKFKWNTIADQYIQAYKPLITPDYKK